MQLLQQLTAAVLPPEYIDTGVSVLTADKVQ